MKKSLKIALIALVPLSGVILAGVLGINYHKACNTPWWTFTPLSSEEISISASGAIFPCENTYLLTSNNHITQYTVNSAGQLEKIRSFNVPGDEILKLVADPERGYLYCLQEHTFHIMAFDANSSLTCVQEYNISDKAYDFLLVSDYAYMVTESTFFILNLHNLDNITRDYFTILRPGEHGISLDQEGKLLFLANFLDGVSIYNVSDPAAPEKLGLFRSYGTGAYYQVNRARNVLVSGNDLVILDDMHGLIIADKQDPTNIQKLADQWVSGSVNSVELTDKFLLVPTGPDGLVVYNWDGQSIDSIPMYVDRGTRAFDCKIIATNQSQFLLSSPNGLSVYEIKPGEGDNPKAKAKAIEINITVAKVWGIVVAVIALSYVVTNSKYL